MHHGWRGNGDENLVPGAELKQTPLVHGMQGVLSVRCPTFGAHTLKQLDGPQVGRLLVDALDQLVAGALLLTLAR